MHTQPCLQDMANETINDDDSMEFCMTNLKRNREDRVLEQVDLKIVAQKSNDKKIDNSDTPERKKNLKRAPQKKM